VLQTRPRAAVIGGLVAAALAGASVQAAPAHAVGGGTPAPDGSYRFVAKINIGEVRSCTGALVSPRWVLTAATCFAESPGEAVPAGPPKHATTATIGRPNLSTTTGHEVNVTMLVPRPDRNAVLAKLARPILDVAPIKIGATAPAAGELLRVAGYGRTGRTDKEWVPDLLHTAAFSVQETNGTTFNITDQSAADASTCKGDSGGPAFREVNGGVELVGLNSTSWQHKCVAETEARRGATETRVDGLAGWVAEATKERPESDFNGDGKADLVGLGLDGKQLWWAENNSVVGKPSTGNGYPFRGPNWGVISKQAFADFDGDGRTDIIGRYSKSLMIWLNTSTVDKPNYADGIGIGKADEWGDIGRMAYTDFDGDGKVDILGFDSAKNTRLKFVPNTSTVGKLSFGTRVDVGLDGWEGVRERWLADFDGDGMTDILGRHGDNLMLWLNTSTVGKPANGKFITLKLDETLLWKRLDKLFLTDFDGDGKVDVLGYGQGSAQLNVVLNTSSVGTPSTAAKSVTIGGLDWKTVRDQMFADFDGDGKTDIIGRQLNFVKVWLNTSTVGKPAHGGPIQVGTDWKGIARFLQPGTQFL
jgi:hypothetical protein